MRHLLVVLILAACASKTSGTESTPAPAPTEQPASGGDLPETLTPAEIEAGLAPAKAAAKAECSKLAAGGELLKMVVVINGPAANVTVVEIVEFADNPKLARCYSTELGKATFKPVRQPEIRVDDQIQF